jgi:hypothetical protein
MKKNILCLLLAVSLHVHGQIKMIIRADDLGSCRASNLGVMEACKNGIGSVTEVMVPCPWFNDAVRLLQENPRLDVGLHLVLNSEWAYYRWRPLTAGKTIIDRDGYFHQTVWSGGGISYLLGVKLDMAEVEAEFRAQIETALKKIPQISHISEHMYFGTAKSDLRTLVNKLAAEYNLGVEPSLAGMGVKTFNFPTGTDFDSRKTAFIEALNNLTPGIYHFLAHPCAESIELSQFTVDGNPSTNELERIADFHLFTDSDVMKIMTDKNIELIGYRDLLMKAPLKAVLVTPVDSTTTNKTTISFEWKPLYPAIENYQIEISDSLSFSNAYSDSSLVLTKITIPVSQLPQTHQLYWKVRAKNSRGWGPWSETFRIYNSNIASSGKGEFSVPGCRGTLDSKNRVFWFPLDEKSFEGLHVTVSDMQGRLALSRSLDAHFVDLGGLAPGVYIIVLTGPQWTCSQKFTIQ